MKTSISALMTVYNGERYIAEAIQSVLDQTYTDFELIIVNDGSIDSTAQVVTSFEDPRIRYIELEQRHGVGGAILEGLKLAQSEYIAKVDADDLYHPERFAKQIDFLNRHQHIGLVDTWFEYFPDNDAVRESSRYKQLHEIEQPKNNRIFTSEDISKYLYWFVCVIHSGIMFRRQLLELETYRNWSIGEDYDLFYRWNKQGVGMYKLNEVLTYVRISEVSTSVTENKNIVPMLMNLKSDEINKLFSNCKEIFVFGTGGLGKEVYSILKLQGKKVHGFIDRDEKKINTLFMDEPVFSWTDLCNRDSVGVLIAATPVNFEIANMLEENGLHHLEQYIVIF